MFGIKKKIEVDSKIRRTVLDLRATISAAKAAAVDLSGQLDSSTKELKLIDVKLELSERSRDKTMDKFVSHEIDEAARDASVQAVRDLRRKRETVKGIVSACERGIVEAKAQIGKSGIELQSIERVFWQNLYDQLKVQINEELGAMFLRANTARIFSTPPGSPAFWNERVFDHEFGNLWPSHEQMVKYSGELEKEFLLD